MTYESFRKGRTYNNIKNHTKKTELHSPSPACLRIKNDIRRFYVRNHVEKKLQEITISI